MALPIDLTGRRALITGAGQGVGHGPAHAFASAGAGLLVNDLRSERADAVVDELLAADGQASAAVFGVTDFDAVTKPVAAAGIVDILVNNAASKAGAAALMRSTAVETGRHGVTANNIAPGTIRTPMTKPFEPSRRTRHKPRRFFRSMRFADRAIRTTPPPSLCCLPATTGRGSPARRFR